jgi:hypothetical protein
MTKIWDSVDKWRRGEFIVGKLKGKWYAEAIARQICRLQKSVPLTGTEDKE